MKQQVRIGFVITMAFAFINTYAQTTITGTTLPADTSTKKDTIKHVITSTWYVEVGGNALFYSLNYEKVLKTCEKYKLAWRGGIGINPSNKDTYLPIEFNYLRSVKNNFLELGIGFTPSIADWKGAGFGGTLEKNFQGITTLRIGYRFISLDKRWMFRIGVLLLWRSVFINQHQSRTFFYEKRDYYSNTTIGNGIRESIVPWFGVSFGYNLFE